MEQVVELIDKVLVHHEDEKVTAEVRGEVNRMMEDFPLYK
jgi:glycine/serine hydroxymethyltransferase